MKKHRLIICMILSVLCMATIGCKTHDDDDDDNPINPTNTSLVGKTWRYDDQRRTALINFTSQRFTVSATEFNHDSYESYGTYSYDGDFLEFVYDGTTYKVWCAQKASGTTLAGTKWISEKTYSNGRSFTGTLEFYSDGSFVSMDFLDFGNYYKKSNAFYSYNGQTISFTKPGEGTASLECGNILYAMSKSATNAW